MVAVRKILCPVDFSETSRHAFEYAALFARQCGAEITVLHVLEDVPLFTAYSGMPEINLRERVEESARKDLAAFVTGAGPGAAPLCADLIHGRTYSAILRYAEEKGFDLIVMGTHGRSGLDYAFFGSVAERVIRRAPCPVVIVRLPDGQKTAHPERK